MSIYKYSADNVELQRYGGDVKVTIPSLTMPFQKCKTCKVKHSYRDWLIPESPTAEVKRILRRTYKQEPLSPEQYSLVETQIRELMLFADNRRLPPMEPFGEYKVLVRSKPEVDIVMGVVYSPCAILTEKAIDELRMSGLTGLIFYPFGTTGKQHLNLYTVLVTGEAGLPVVINDKAEWQQCPSCNEYWLVGESDYASFAPPSIQDGTDFFHVEGLNGIYVSEKAKEWLQKCDLNLQNSFEAIEHKLQPPVFTSMWEMRHFDIPKPVPPPWSKWNREAD